MTGPRALPGARFQPARARPGTLGAGFDGDGSTFAVFSEHATHVGPCLHDDAGRAATFRADRGRV